MESDSNKRLYFKKPTFERDLDFVIKVLEKCGAKDIESSIILSEKTHQILYPPQYKVSLKGIVDWQKYNSYFYN